jgi:uncharacterized protein YecE (DUF72 family)
MGEIRVGIGGWTYEPWRGTFYPEGTRQKDELSYAAARLTAIEINGTYYGSQKPESFANWAKAVPDGFKFSVKASRFCTNRRVLAEAGESVGRFVNQGLSELGDRLGPILWQFAATKQFDKDDMAAFIALLPDNVAGLPLRHAFEVRHESFRDPAFTALMKKANGAIVFADHPEYPCIDEDTADFRYARLMKTTEEEPLGYGDAALDGWCDDARKWAKAGDAFVFFISGAKVRAPAAAQALIKRLTT